MVQYAISSVNWIQEMEGSIEIMRMWMSANVHDCALALLGRPIHFEGIGSRGALAPLLKKVGGLSPSATARANW